MGVLLATDVALSGNLALVTGGFFGLSVVDVTDPSAPREIGSVETSGNAQGVAVSEGDIPRGPWTTDELKPYFESNSKS